MPYFGPGEVKPGPVKYNATHNKFVYTKNRWQKVKNSQEFDYWNEFKKQMPRNVDLKENMCGDSGRQSPIDVRGTGAECLEYHEIRHRVSAERSAAYVPVGLSIGRLSLMLIYVFFEKKPLGK